MLEDTCERCGETLYFEGAGHECFDEEEGRLVFVIATNSNGHSRRRLLDFAIDLDGPLYEFDKTMRYLLREERGCTGIEQPSFEWLLPNQPWHSVTNEDWNWLWTEGVRMGLFRHGHVTKHAVRAIRLLRARGFKMGIVTHRPTSAVRDTLAWLDFHFGSENPYPFAVTPIMLPDGGPKTVSPASVLIDDKPENCEEWAMSGRRAFLFTRPWNESYPCSGTIKRVDGWYGVLKECGQR